MIKRYFKQFWNKHFKFPKYRVREFCSGQYLAEVKKSRKERWDSCFTDYARSQNVSMGGMLMPGFDLPYNKTYKSVKDAQADIEKHYIEHLENIRPKYLEEYKPIADSPLLKALK